MTIRPLFAGAFSGDICWCLHFFFFFFCLTGARRVPKFAVEKKNQLSARRRGKWREGEGRGRRGGSLTCTSPGPRRPRGPRPGFPCFELLEVSPSYLDRLLGLVVKASASRADSIPGSNPACAGIFPGSSHTSDLKIGTPVATLPGAWRYRVSTGTGWLGVSILWVGEMESWICNFYLSVAARNIV